MNQNALASGQKNYFRDVVEPHLCGACRSNPPTWYPRGIRSDCPTDFRSGEWVITGSHDGTRFFIPLHVSGGIPRKTLLKEALAARGPDVCRPPPAKIVPH